MAVVEVETGDVLVTKADGILRLQLNRADKKNALTRAMYTTMADALAAAREDGTIRAAYITGTEGCFTSGNDIKDFMQSPQTGPDSPVGRFLSEILTFNKPLVAGVTGIAIGIGTTLLLHCDLAYAAEGAKFQMPFVNLGLCPEAGSSYILPRVFGHRRASELLLLNKAMTASEARELGLVNEVFAADALESEVAERLKTLAAQPPGCVRLTKSLLKSAELEATQAAMTAEGNHFAQLLTSPEAMEAFTAFMERRAPDFSKFE